MPIDPVSSAQITTVVLFLVVLGTIWLLVKRSKGGIPLSWPSRGLANVSRRMRLAEILPLGPGERMMIVTVDGRDFLMVMQRGAAPALTELDPPPAFSDRLAEAM